MSDLTPSAIRYAIEEWFDEEYDYTPGWDEVVSELTKDIKTDIGTFSVVDYEIIGGYEQEVYTVIKHHESGRTFRWEGYYTSYDGASFDHDGHEVVEAEVKRTVWVKK